MTTRTTARTDRLQDHPPGPRAAPGPLRAWLLLGAGVLVVGNMLAAPAPAVAQSALSVGAILQGIVGYTAWPDGTQPLVLCISRAAADAAEIQRQVPALQDGRQLEAVLVEPDQALPARCSAVYLEGWADAPLHALLLALADRPVLTLGRGPAFCSNGGMFCLQSDGQRTRFEANLDAIARSGLRVRPQVLRLARPLQRKDA